MFTVLMVGVLLGIVALLLGMVVAFYYLAALGGWATQAWFGAPYVGVGIVNAVTLMLAFLMGLAGLLTMAERKWASFIQDRIGPNRARLPGIPIALGGIPHFLADGIKMLTKEDVIPARAEKVLYWLGPMMAFAPVLIIFGIVPVAPALDARELIPAIGTSFPVSLQIIPGLDVGLLFVFAFAGLAVYGASLGGWASANKLSLLGGVRAASQMIAYEVGLGLSLVGMFMAYATLSPEKLAAFQGTPILGGVLPAWGIFLQPLGFVLFFAASFAETKRAPFDMPEGESEIVGYFVEYSGMRFGLYMFGEFIEIVVLAAITATVFFGGWHLPDIPALGLEAWLLRAVGPVWLAFFQGAFFFVKVIVLCYLQLAIRWTFPRFRYDQVQALGWKILLPMGLANVFVTGVLVLLDASLDLLAIVGLLQLALMVGVTVLYRAPRPKSVESGSKPSLAHAPAHH
jgi:NADH-quinone oxidoreductase subunit H